MTDEEMWIKLIWDFRGPDGYKTAEHHRHHVLEFLEHDKLPQFETGVEQLTENHSISYMIIQKKDLLSVRDDLKPHRAIVVG